jgi:L-asparaginase
MNLANKRFLVLLTISTIVVCIITVFVAINHQQKIDNQIISSSIHMLNTKEGYEDPNFKQQYEKIKHKVGLFDYVDNYSSNLSSVNVVIDDWNNLVDYIKYKYYSYNAFVIIVDSSTLLYTACAISFMIENIDRPIIFTDGSDIAMSLLLASQTKIPEVMVVCDNKLHRALRISSIIPNVYKYPPLTDKNCLSHNFEKPSIKYINPTLVVPIIKVFPGIDEKYMKSFIENKNIQGIILELWGEGVAPTNIGFLKAIKTITNNGIVVLCVSECDNSKFECNIDIRLLDAGCLSGYNMTTQAAYAKLVFLLSNVPDRKIIGKLMEINFRGEMSI